MALHLHLPTGARSVPAAALSTLRTSFDRAVALTAVPLGTDSGDVAVLAAPELAIPGWGIGGYTHGPDAVLIGIDPDVHLDPARVTATLVHELHHVRRERGPGCGTSLRERLVSEGLAMLFEEELLGAASEFAHQHIDDRMESLASAHLDDDPADDGRWFFATGELPLWFGYTFGYRRAKRFCEREGVSAAAAADLPAHLVLP